MAAQTTALTEFSDNGNSRTYVTSTHTTAKPRLVVQKRKVPVGNQTVAEVSIDVVHASADGDGVVLPQKVAFSAVFRQPLAADAVDVAAALVIFRDIIAGDEFANAVSTQEFLV